MAEAEIGVWEEQMFFNSFTHAVDAQGRIAFPGEWRKVAGDSAFVMLPARNKALVLLPQKLFQEFLAGARKMAVANPKIQLAFAKIGSLARLCRCDKQGRMALDRTMLSLIYAESSVTLIGSLNHIRLTAPEDWKEPSIDDLNLELDELQKLGEGAGDAVALLRSILGGE